MSEEQEAQAIEPEVMPPETAITKQPLPVTVEELANLPQGLGLEKIQNRVKILESLRKASIALTFPQDWLLFKAEDRITAYLQDSGCKRVWQIWGIEITPKGDFRVIKDEENTNGDYAIECTADGICRATGLFVEGVKGVRYSMEDFCASLPAIQKKVRVEQASVANRDGNIIRALTGLKNVAIEEIESVYKAQGTGKSTALCPRGRGFGSSRPGFEKTPTDVPPPVCEMCNKPMRFMAATKDYLAYWKCADYAYDREKKTSNGHSRIKDEDYRNNLEKSKPAGEQHGN